MKRAGVLLLLAACGGGSGSNATLTPPRAPVVASGDLDAHKLLAETSARAIALGAGPASIVASGQISAGERIGAFVEIPTDACLLTYARASPSLEDIDVAVFAEEGNPVVVDEGPDAYPTVLLCPPHPSRVYAAVHAASGEGLVALSAQIVPRDHAVEIGKALRAHGTRGEMASAEAWPGLGDHVQKHRASLGGTWEEVRRVAVAIDERAPTNVSMAIDAGECIDALVLAGEDTSLLDAEVVDDTTRVVARANGVGKELSLVVCSETALAAMLVVRPHVGAGVAAVVLSRTPIATGADIAAPVHLAWVPSRASLSDARTRLDAELAKVGYGASISATTVTAVLGRRTTVPLEAGDACRRIDVIGGAPVGWLHASVWDDKGTDLGQAVGSSQVVLFACGKSKVGVDLEVRGRGGSVAVVARKERWQSPVFATLPLAASRMLQRASESMGDDVPPGAVRQLSIDASRREVWESSVAQGSCAFVTAGVEGAGTGVAVQAIDVATGDVIDRGAAMHAASVRSCARSSPRRVRYEVRVTSGKLDIVVGESTRAVAATP